jgi:photosynthetic reaction center cytochrome c subunit/tetratricopeptide repeat protein
MTRTLSRVLAFSITTLIASAANAQTPAPAQQPPPMTNLQLYPKETPRAEIVATMQGFTQALGVQCTYCHMGQAPNFDFASDAKPTKTVARKMILMAREVTAKMPEITGKPAADITRLRCATCHRGVAIPKLLPDIVTETVNKSGTAAAIEQYRDLRKKYYGAQAYDFSENALAFLGQQLTNANKPDEALALLQLNAEYYPNHPATYGMMAQAYMKKNDKDNAIKSLEKAVQLDPNNQQAKRQLEQLKK